MTALRLGAFCGVLAGCGTLSGPPCQRFLAADPQSVEARHCLIAHYPATLPPCERALPALTVDEALGDGHRTGETATVRGRLARPDGSCTDMDCGGDVCCNDCNVGFTLLGGSQHGLSLERWRQAPKISEDCDFSVALDWLPKLEIVVRGVLRDELIPSQAGGDLLAPPPHPPAAHSRKELSDGVTRSRRRPSAADFRSNEKIGPLVARDSCATSGVGLTVRRPRRPPAC